MTGTPVSATDPIPLRDAARAWFGISLQTFGGPAGQIAVMQHELVEKRRWIGPDRFLHALGYCMLLPGPEAQQLATYLGWLLNGWRGGLVAGGLFVLPGVATMMALSALYVGYADTTVVDGLFAGIGPAVVAIVLQAMWRLGRRTLRSRALLAIAVGTFGLLLLGVPFPLLILGAGLLGVLLKIQRPASHEVSEGPEPLISDALLHHDPPSARRQVAILTLGLGLWLVPLLAVAALLGTDDVITQQTAFYSGTALVSFGGAYAVLSFVAQQAVNNFGWISTTDMVRGLGLAESTPGPLVLVLQFVAFVAAYNAPGSLNPWVAGVLGALLAVWATFVPCFVFVFLGAPYVERLRSNKALGAALTAVMAAVVGVIGTLAWYFIRHTLVDLQAWLLTAVAFGLMLGAKQSPLRTVMICAIFGLGLTFI